MRRKSRAVRAAMRRQSEEGMRPIGRPHAHCPVPTTTAETVLRDEVPVHAEDFAVVLFPVLDWEVGDLRVEELDASVAGGG